MAHTILSISGTDASGKGTISKMVQERLAEKNITIEVISPPFYDTPIGGEVGEYLKSGYKCWRSRKLASALYAADRNWWMREHFDKVFLNPDCQIALYNRNWVDSLFYQTTLIAQTHADTARFPDIAQQFHVKCEGIGEYDLTLQDLHNIFEVPASECVYDEQLKVNYIGANLNAAQKKQLHQFYMGNRLAMIRDHMRFLFELEIEPYQTIDGTIVTSAMDVHNIVLIPTKRAARAIIRNNLLKRYEDNPAMMDRNEKSLDYQVAVIENIEWIHQHFDDIVQGTQPGTENLQPTSPWARDMDNKRSRTPFSDDIRKAFTFDIIYITDEKGYLRMLDEIADDVIGKLNLPK